MNNHVAWDAACVSKTIAPVEEFLCGNPASKTLTAHVNFTALELWGEKRSGPSKTAGFTSQTAFLLALGQGNEFGRPLRRGAIRGGAHQSAGLQLKTLIHPEGMGERFQVLVQQRA